jgi:hypothetical protein
MKLLLAKSKALNQQTRKAIKKIAKNAKGKKQKQEARYAAMLLALSYVHNSN